MDSGPTTEGDAPEVRVITDVRIPFRRLAQIALEVWLASALAAVGAGALIGIIYFAGLLLWADLFGR